jgi:tRNA pseudouridine13 synthase
LLYSALQSAVFNAVLDHRVADGTWKTPLLGDVLEKTDSGGMFVCTDVQVDCERAARGEVVPTGPMLGPKMVKPAANVGELEAKIAADFLGADATVSLLTNASGLGEGTRRPLVLPVQELHVEPILPSDGEQLASCRVYFVIPKGAYATTVLSQVFVWKEIGRVDNTQQTAGPATTDPPVDASLSEESHRDD